MKKKVRLAGASSGFIQGLKPWVEYCGHVAVIDKRPIEKLASLKTNSVYVFEVSKASELKALAKRGFVRPYLLYCSGVPFYEAHTDALRSTGCVGVITEKTAPETLSYLLNKAAYYSASSRRNQRASITLPVTITSNGRTIKTVSSQISRDGMFIVTLNPLPEKTIVSVEFSLPRARRAMATDANVLYTVALNKELNIIAPSSDPFRRVMSHPGMAIGFLTLLPKDRDAIDSFVKKSL